MWEYSKYYFSIPKPLGCFAGLCGCNARELNVRLQHSLLVAFHYKPEADHRLSLGGFASGLEEGVGE